jgi:hypothetical protein
VDEAKNGGWALFITTARGRNHAKSMLDMAQTRSLDGLQGHCHIQ